MISVSMGNDAMSLPFADQGATRITLSGKRSGRGQAHQSTAALP